MLAQFRVAFICWTIPRIVGNSLCECFNKRNTFEQIHGNLSVHLTHVERHGVINDREFSLDFLHELTAHQHFNQTLFGLNALKRSFVFDVERQQTEQLGQERDSEEDLRRSVHAPIQQVNQR